MFQVRSYLALPRAMPPNLQLQEPSRRHACTRLEPVVVVPNYAPPSVAASRLPAPSSHRTVCPACDPRQYATAFNQPLSWDTSRVTDMSWMFQVRCSPYASRALHPISAGH